MLLSRMGLVKTFLLSGGDKSSRSLTGELESVHARIQRHQRNMNKHVVQIRSYLVSGRG